MREMLRRKFIWIESVETIHRKTKRRVKLKDIENVYDLMEAIREEVADREGNRLEKEIEALLKDMSYFSVWDNAKLMRDIREEGSRREN